MHRSVALIPNIYSNQKKTSRSVRSQCHCEQSRFHIVKKDCITATKQVKTIITIRVFQNAERAFGLIASINKEMWQRISKLRMVKKYQEMEI